MAYLSVKKTATRWNLSERRVRELCQEGRVTSAFRTGRDWLIPSDAQRPLKGTAGKTTSSKERLELYLNPTYCESLSLSTASIEERLLCGATDLFLKGYFKESKRVLDQFVESHPDDSYLLVAQMMLYLICSCIDPDAKNAEIALSETEKTIARNPGFRYTKSIVACARGKRIEPTDLAHIPSKFVPIFAESACTLNAMDDLSGRNQADLACLELLIRMLDDEDQPALALYGHVVLALYSNLKHQAELYEQHIRKSLEIALPRKWYAPLANYSYALDWHEVKEIDPTAYGEIQKLSGSILGNYVKTGHLGKAIPKVGAMTEDEFKVAYMNAKGMSIKDIANILGVSTYRIRKTLMNAYHHSDTTNRKELRALLNEQFKAI